MDGRDKCELETILMSLLQECVVRSLNRSATFATGHWCLSSFEQSILHVCVGGEAGGGEERKYARALLNVSLISLF